MCPGHILEGQLTWAPTRARTLGPPRRMLAAQPTPPRKPKVPGVPDRTQRDWSWTSWRGASHLVSLPPRTALLPVHCQTRFPAEGTPPGTGGLRTHGSLGEVGGVFCCLSAGTHSLTPTHTHVHTRAGTNEAHTCWLPRIAGGAPGLCPLPYGHRGAGLASSGKPERAENGRLDGRRAEGRSGRDEASGAWGWLIGEPRRRLGPDCGGGASGQRGGTRRAPA